MDCSPPGSSIHGILQARILEWVAIPVSRGSSDPGIKPESPALQVDSLPSEPPAHLLNPVFKLHIMLTLKIRKERELVLFSLGFYFASWISKLSGAELCSFLHGCEMIELGHSMKAFSLLLGKGKWNPFLIIITTWY